jgi:hypothetical protein
VDGDLPNLLGITSDLKRWINRQTGFWDSVIVLLPSPQKRIYKILCKINTVTTVCSVSRESYLRAVVIRSGILAGFLTR